MLKSALDKQKNIETEEVLHSRTPKGLKATR